MDGQIVIYRVAALLNKKNVEFMKSLAHKINPVHGGREMFFNVKIAFLQLFVCSKAGQGRSGQ